MRGVEGRLAAHERTVTNQSYAPDRLAPARLGREDQTAPSGKIASFSFGACDRIAGRWDLMMPELCGSAGPVSGMPFDAFRSASEPRRCPRASPGSR